MSLVEIFSDGACSGNPGPGGYGTIVRHGNSEKEFSGYDPDTTNNRMELLGAIAGFEALTRPCSVQITTDSQYVKKGMTEWIDGWIKKGWKNSQRKAVANRDLWERLLAATVSKSHRVNLPIPQETRYCAVAQPRPPTPINTICAS